MPLRSTELSTTSDIFFMRQTSKKSIQTELRREGTNGMYWNFSSSLRGTGHGTDTKLHLLLLLFESPTLSTIARDLLHSSKHRMKKNRDKERLLTTNETKLDPYGKTVEELSEKSVSFSQLHHLEKIVTHSVNCKMMFRRVVQKRHDRRVEKGCFC